MTRNGCVCQVHGIHFACMWKGSISTFYTRNTSFWSVAALVLRWLCVHSCFFAACSSFHTSHVKPGWCSCVCIACICVNVTSVSFFPRWMQHFQTMIVALGVAEGCSMNHPLCMNWANLPAQLVWFIYHTWSCIMTDTMFKAPFCLGALFWLSQGHKSSLDYLCCCEKGGFVHECRGV